MDLSLRRLRPGEWLALAGGVALLVSLFVVWYGASVDVGARGFERSAGSTGWRSFAVLDVLLAVAALPALALAAAQATQDGPAVPVGIAVVTVVLGSLAVVLVAFRIVDQPGPDEFIEIRAGAWLALAAAVAVAAGGWLALRDERVPGAGPGPEPELRAPPP